MTQYERAKKWRQDNGWSLDDLADLTGYSRSSILWFERGTNNLGRKVDPYSWQRYKRICHSVAIDREGTAFDWEG